MLNHLQWRTLEMHRTDVSLIMLYKITQDLLTVDHHGLLMSVARQTRQTHPYSYIQMAAKRDCYRLLFFLCTIIQWNVLPIDVVSAPLLSSFCGLVSELDHLRIF